MNHLYSVEGDFDLMMHWDRYFGAVNAGANADEPQAAENAAEPKTNMMLLLVPWIVFWIAAAIDGFWGSLASVAICVLLPVFDASHQGHAVRPALGCGRERLLHRIAGRGLPILVIPASYFLFGLMDRFLLYDGTAHRTLFQEQLQRGRGAAQPDLYKTNRILTAAWGILYLITPTWTYLIMQTSAADFVGAIN